MPAGFEGEFHGLAVGLIEHVVGQVGDVLGRLNGKDLVHWDCPLWDVGAALVRDEGGLPMR
jgi:hypothetical protein